LVDKQIKAVTYVLVVFLVLVVAVYLLVPQVVQVAQVWLLVLQVLEVVKELSNVLKKYIYWFSFTEIGKIEKKEKNGSANISSA